MPTGKLLNELPGAASPEAGHILGGPQVVGRLDIVDPVIVKFFKPAADKVMGSADPTAAMAAALAALSGVTSVPKPRSLLAQVLWNKINNPVTKFASSSYLSIHRSGPVALSGSGLTSIAY